MAIFSKRWRLALPALLLAAAGVSAAATLAEPISKLGGASDETARSVLAHNGYVARGEKSSWGRKQTYWWSAKARQCVLLTSMASRVLYVESKGPSDCIGTSAGAGGTLIDPAQLVGLPRKAAEARLAAAGFGALSTDESKPDAIYLLWFNGRQCLAGTVVNDHYDLLAEMPMNNCRK